MHQIVDIHEAKSTLSKLVKRVEAGEEIVIARNGKPVVRMTPIQAEKPKLPWGALHRMGMTDDFDAPST